VDLAGSERLAKTKAVGQTMKEGLAFKHFMIMPCFKAFTSMLACSLWET